MWTRMQKLICILFKTNQYIIIINIIIHKQNKIKLIIFSFIFKR